MAAEQIVGTTTAEAVRLFDTKAVGMFLGGAGVGIAIGFYLGYRWNKEKIKVEAFKNAEEEIEKIRETYRQKTMAATAKPAPEDIIEEKGYVVVEEVPERPTKPPVPVQEPTRTSIPHFIPGTSVAKRHEDREKDKNDGWDYTTELAQRRSATRPYIIHQDEFAQNETEFNQSTLIYYSVDEVLVDEDEITKIENPEDIVGLDNLARFGHGTDDEHVLYVRNTRLELEYEICLLPKSYEEEVQGLTHEVEPD